MSEKADLEAAECNTWLSMALIAVVGSSDIGYYVRKTSIAGVEVSKADQSARTSEVVPSLISLGLVRGCWVLYRALKVFHGLRCD